MLLAAMHAVKHIRTAIVKNRRQVKRMPMMNRSYITTRTIRIGIEKRKRVASSFCMEAADNTQLQIRVAVECP